MPVGLALLMSFTPEAPKFLVSLNVTLYAQRFKIVPVIAEAFHLREGLGGLHWYLVMEIHGSRRTSEWQSFCLTFTQASLTQRVFSKVPDSQFLPSLGVQQLLILFASAHVTILL